MVLVVASRVDEVVLLVFVGKLDFERGFDVYLRIDVDIVLDKLRLVDTFAHVIGASDDQDLGFRNISDNVINYF